MWRKRDPYAFPWFWFVFWTVVGIVVVFGGSWLVVDYVWRHDMRAAEADCAQYGAVPHYTYRTRYLCLLPDGRVAK